METLHLIKVKFYPFLTLTEMALFLVQEEQPCLLATQLDHSTWYDGRVLTLQMERPCIWT